MLLSYREGGFTKVRPLRESDHADAVELVFFLQDEWSKLILSDEERTRAIVSTYWDLIQSVCLMLPTVQGLGWQIEKLKSDFELIQYFLLHPECQFWKLHEFKVKGKEDRPDCLNDPEVDLTPENLPFPTCGNINADKIASYLHGTDWGPVAIKKLFDWCSREEIAGIQYVIGELASPDRRIQEEKQRIADNFYAVADPSLFDSNDKNFKWENSDEMQS